jgi:hypothetical protein
MTIGFGAKTRTCKLLVTSVPEPDPSARDMDLRIRIRIRTKMSWIRIIACICNEEIILRAFDTEPVSSRGHLGLNKEDLVIVSRMVVVYPPEFDPFFSVLARGKAGRSFFFYKFFNMSFKG